MPAHLSGLQACIPQHHTLRPGLQLADCNCIHCRLAKQHIAHQQAAAAAEARSAEEEEEPAGERDGVGEVLHSLAAPFRPSAKLNAVMGIVRDHSGALLVLHTAWLIPCEAMAQKAEAGGACFMPHNSVAPTSAPGLGPLAGLISSHEAALVFIWDLGLTELATSAPGLGPIDWADQIP